MEDKATQIPVEAGKDGFSMEAALQEAEARLEKTVARGQIIPGKVVFVSHDGVMVDIGTRTEGIIPLNQLTEEELPEAELRSLLKPGEEVLVYVIRVDPETGQAILSKKRAEADYSWKRVQELFERGETLSVVIKERVKGGLVTSIHGLRAFLPASQVDLKRVSDLEEYVGQSLRVRIIEFNRKKGRIILSRRVVLEEEQKQRRENRLSQLQPGQEVEGEVVEITEFGVFVSLGGVDGLVHRSEISWGRFNHPQEVIQKGQKVRAKVLSVDTERERVNLSIKALTPDPWLTVTEKYPVGSRVRGRVVGLTDFGAFVEVEPGLEGLIHISELSWTKRPKHPSEVLKEGEEVEAVVLRIDTQERRLSLGLRQTRPDPWKTLPDRYPPGTLVKGPITGITSFGVFVEIEPGIEGLIHISELDYSRIENPAQLFKPGDEVEAVILNIDPTEQRVSLSRKRLLPPPLPAAEEERERPKGRAKRKRGSARSSARQDRPAGGERELEGGYEAPLAPVSGASVKLGDLYGDLLSELNLEEEQES
jgi:small subunit ribosomal protein S1